MELWAGCIAGALEESEYRSKLARAGFDEIGVEPTRLYSGEDARGYLEKAGLDADRVAREIDGKLMSAFIRARKPALRACCA
jgi:arsenite methyltransferase